MTLVVRCCSYISQHIITVHNPQKQFLCLLTKTLTHRLAMDRQLDKPPLGAILLNLPPALTQSVIDVKDKGVSIQSGPDDMENENTKHFTNTTDECPNQNFGKTPHYDTAVCSSLFDAKTGDLIKQTEYMYSVGKICSDAPLTDTQLDTGDGYIPCTETVTALNPSLIDKQSRHLATGNQSINKQTEHEPVSVEFPSVKARCEKKTVLPKVLLANVTDLVKQQQIKLPQDNTINPAESGVCDTSVVGTAVVKTQEDHEHVLMEIDNELPETLGKFSESVIDTKDVDVPHDVSTDISVEEDFYSEHALLCPDIFEEFRPDTQKTEEVYDISSLFKGELDKRYKSEKKKAIKRKGKKAKLKKKGEQRLASEEEEEESQKNERQKPVPNYFIAIQITNQQIHDALRLVQEEVLTGNQLLASAMIKLTKLHLTLMVLRLENNEDMARSRLALDKAIEKLRNTYSNKTLKMDLCGLGNFRNEIVFANIREEQQVEELKAIVDMVEDSFLEQELVSTDKRGFKPHITVMKLSKAKHLRRKGIKKIDESLYEKFKSTEFGTQDVTTIQLCAMMKTDPSGYYHVEHKVHFTSGNSTEEDLIDDEHAEANLDENTKPDDDFPNSSKDTSTVAEQAPENIDEVKSSSSSVLIKEESKKEVETFKASENLIDNAREDQSPK